MKKVKVLCVRFANEIRNDEIEYFRGAVLSKLQQASVLFHNHEGNGFRYAYPLIQYKRLNGKAALVCLEEGANDVGQLFTTDDFSFMLRDRKEDMKVDSMKARQVLVQVWEDDFMYHLNRWLPLNEKNYKTFQGLDGLVEKYAFLEKKLVGNILAFAKGMSIFFEKEVKCKIVDCEEPYWIFYKGIKMMCFNVRFKTNVSLPDFVGLGKGVSLGHGIVSQIRKKIVKSRFVF